jgi:hypothetical protein
MLDQSQIVCLENLLEGPASSICGSTLVAARWSVSWKAACITRHMPEASRQEISTRLEVIQQERLNGQTILQRAKLMLWIQL